MLDAVENRYAEMIFRLIGRVPPFVAESEDGEIIQVERGNIFTAAVVDQLTPKSFDSLTAPRDVLTVADRLGQVRPAYAGVLIYAWVQAFGLAEHQLPPAERERCRSALLAWAAQLDDFLPMLLPQLDRHVPLAAWTALAMMAAGTVLATPAWCDKARATVQRIVAGQTPKGTFVSTTAADNLESFWYDELVILHALGSFAVQWPSAATDSALSRAIEYHFNEIQPDHATGEPWGLLSFIIHAPTRMLADQILHGVSMQYPNGISGVPAILLADALHCLRLRTKA